MISFLYGKITALSLDSPLACTVLVGGVGYEVFIHKTMAQTLNIGCEASLSIHTHVREDALQLFGFGELAERQLFRLLLQVSGVGPRVAMGLLGELGWNSVVSALVERNTAALTRASGVGKKNAEKLILELAPKLMRHSLLTQIQTAHPGGTSVPSNVSPHANGATGGGQNLWLDVQSALINMGYERVRVNWVLEQLQQQGVILENLNDALRMSLRWLSQPVDPSSQTVGQANPTLASYK